MMIAKVLETADSEVLTGSDHERPRSFDQKC